MAERVVGALRAFGEYRLLRRLATGGMAEIFLAKQIGPMGFERDVVIKRLKPELYDKDDFLKMFLDEVRLAARLSHPNVVQIHDVGCIAGHYFLCMEYLAGDDLGTILRECGRKDMDVPPMIAARLIAQAAHGLHYAHELRDADGAPLHIVHRDVSPANLFVTYQGHVTVLDFGIARAEARIVNTGGGRLKGKTPYIAPELISGRQADPRSDVYALALTLYVTLTRHQPFLRENPLATLRAVRDGQIDPIGRFRDDVPGELEQIVRKGIEKYPDRRYQTAGDFAAALERFLAGYTASTAHRETALWLRQVLGEERIRERSFVPSIAALQARGVRVTGFTDPELHTPGAPTSTPATPPPLPQAAAQSPRPVPAPVSIPASTATPSPAPMPAAQVVRRRTRVVGAAALAAVLLVATGTAAAALLGPGTGEGGDERAEGLGSFAARRPPTTPTLAVDCDVPGALVEIDGRLVGACPLQLDAQPGVHTLIARATGRRPTTRTVEISPHSDRTVVMMQLPPLATKGSEMVVPVAMGRLTLDTVPWTRVYRSGRLLGETPLVEQELPPGRHRLRLVNPERGIDKRVTVVIRAGERTVKRLDLEERL